MLRKLKLDETSENKLLRLDRPDRCWNYGRKNDDNVNHDIDGPESKESRRHHGL